MRQDERKTLRQRFLYRWGYSGVGERDAGAELTVDHFQPRSQGGLHEPGNWVYCCHACNEFESDFWQLGSNCRILHPLREDVAAHIVEREDGTLMALSETGAFHIKKLHLNRPPLVAYRRERGLLEADHLTKQDLLQRLREMEDQLRTLTTQLEQL
jgi:hypothetical protein